MDYLKGLNDKQKEAVEYGEGPLLILAGAGSGKTRVLTHRIAYLIEKRGIFPGNILAITFTNKAANEMKERISNLLENNVEDIWMGTFHSICVRILRRDIDKIGYDRSFSIYDRDDQITLMKECIKELNINKDMYKERSVLSKISELKDQMIEPDTYINQNYSDYFSRNVGELYALYEKKLKAYNALDFDDLILKTIELFSKSPEVLDYYQRKFQYVFVDEFQDTNKSQYELVRLLTGRYKNICVVGDPDQCVVEGSKIMTPKGLVPVEEIKENDSVLCASGRGEVLTGSVEKVMKNTYEGLIIEIKTRSGKVIKTTPNHIMFAKLNPEPGVFYVYLMYKKGKGYRIGITQGVRSRDGEIVNGLAVRLNQEHGDKIWILRICETKEEAVFYEQLYSIKYQIPTACFHVIGRNLSMNQEYIDRLFNEIDTENNVIKLLEDLLLFEEYPHHRHSAIVSGNTIRRIVNLSYFSGRKAGSELGWHSHRISFNTSGDGLKNIVVNSNFPVRDGNRNTWRVETERVDYDEATQYGRELASLHEDIEVVERARLTEEIYFTYMPASHIRANMTIPVYENGKVIEDIVEETTVREYKGYVYDISVPNFRQYICENIVIHNSIYGWRGADISNILNFEKDFKGANTILLEQNYRSTKNILEVANHVIKNNYERKDKDLWTDNEEGQKVVVETLLDEKEEAYFVASKIIELMGGGYSLKDMAILYRTNAQSRSFEEIFMRNNIPYKIVGGLRFYDRKEIKDIMAYLKVIQNPSDNVSLKRIINVPKRGIGNATIDKIEAYAVENDESLYSVMMDIDKVRTLTAGPKKKIKDFIDMMNEFMAMSEVMSVNEFIEKVVYGVGYIKELEKEGGIEAETRLENIKEFISVAVDFEVKNPDGTLEDFLATISLLSDVDKTEDVDNSVTMLTVHSAKGLEFPVVFLVGMEEGLFPIRRALDSESELEEERRLCYVAITRAERLLYITHSKIRTIYGKTSYSMASRFLDEMPRELIQSSTLTENKISTGSQAFTSPRDRFIQVKDYTRKPKEKAVNSTPRPKVDAGEISIGTKVSHSKWGVGTIVQIKDKKDDKEVVIAFDKVGLKRLLLSIAPIEIL